VKIIIEGCPGAIEPVVFEDLSDFVIVATTAKNLVWHRTKNESFLALASAVIDRQLNDTMFQLLDGTGSLVNQ